MIEEPKLTRDERRAAFALTGLDRNDISNNQLKALRDQINAHMEASKCFRGTFRMNDSTGPFLTCRSDYFDDREAVSFNPDGFVGFAG